MTNNLRPQRGRQAEMSFPKTVSDSLCRNYLVMQTDCCSSCPGGREAGGEDAGCGGPGLGVFTRGLRL